MSLRSRLAALERLARESGRLFGNPLCPTCGGPGRSPVSMFLIDAGEELRHCSDCRRPLGEHGQPSGKIVVVLELHHTAVASATRLDLA